jgi:hypothetical protein
MSSADLQISEMVTKNSPSRKNISEASCGILSAKSSESGERMTQYDELYQLHRRLSTARFKLLKAQARVAELEKQIAEVKGKPLEEGWDVT